MRNKIEKFCNECEIEVLFCDGYDEAIIGLGRCFNQFKVVYDKLKVIDILKKSMTQEQAEEFFEFNIVGAYVGEATPIFIETL